MVQVQRKQKTKNGKYKVIFAFILIVICPLAVLFFMTVPERLYSPELLNNANNASTDNNTKEKEEVKIINESNANANTQSKPNHECSYKSLEDLAAYEKNPRASKEFDGNSRRHMVDPPSGGKITLVCCDTTVGQLSVAVHHTWAPLGAQRFLDMVKDDYFSSKVAFMRCVKNFLCQFGIAGIPSVDLKYRHSIQDDPNWLPEGPSHKTNDEGVKRFARGYFAYAGGGKNSRGNQFIVALKDHPRLGGGSPWEVPFGEVVGTESYATLGKISTVYGENGPSQKLLHTEGSSANVAEQFPDLDYMTSCVVVDERFLRPDETN